jgi:hypothetical protein
MVDPDRVLEARMSGSGVDLLREGELTYSLETQERRV